MRFKNKIALVTGAETGIGKNVVKTLLADGCRVVGTNFTKSNLIKNKNLEYYKIDVTSEDEWAAVKNVMTALAPLNASQLNRLRLSIKGTVDDDDPDRFNKYGKEFTLGKELLGMVGLRQIDVDPGEAIKYKINAFQKNVRNINEKTKENLLKINPKKNAKRTK